MKNYLLGVMQGRLLPKYRGRYQAHPVHYWQDEFERAADLGLDLIELILDWNEVEQNPLSSDAGVTHIGELAAKSGVGIRTICADYFMEAPLHSVAPATAQASLRVLQQLIPRASRLGVTDIVVPCVDQSALKDSDDEARLLEALRACASLAEAHRIRFALETDLPPAAFASLLQRAASPVVCVNYDIGNSASLGFDPVEEFAAYGAHVTDIHIKDRLLGGGSVPLGSGNAAFRAFFAALLRAPFNGVFIMQAFRDDEGVEVFRRQLDWIRPQLDDWAQRRAAS